MSSSYWSQWDKSDLDSWQGKDYPGHDDEEEEIEDFEDEDCEIEDGCGCATGCMQCSGMSWRDFL